MSGLLQSLRRLFGGAAAAPEPASAAIEPADDESDYAVRSPWPLPVRMSPAEEFYSFADEEEGNRGVWTDLHHSYFIAQDAASATISCVTQRRPQYPPDGQWTRGEPKVVAQVRTGSDLPYLLRRLAEHFDAIEPATRSFKPQAGWRDLPGGLCCRFAGLEIEVAIASASSAPSSSLIVQSDTLLGQGREWTAPHLWLGPLAARLDGGPQTN